MKALPLSLLVCLLGTPLCPAGEGAGPPVVLPPYRVEERPFGFLGIQHATVSLHPLKLIVGMKPVKFLQIDALEPGSPGVAAGIEPGDRIARIDGVPIGKFGLRELKRMNRELEVGRVLLIDVWRPRDGSTRTLEIVVPPRAPAPLAGTDTPD